MITEEDIKTALGIIRDAIRELPTLKGRKEDEIIPPQEKNVTITLDD